MFNRVFYVDLDMAWIEIPNRYLSADGKIRQVSVSGLTFCLVFHEGHWIAFSKKCPHAGAPLDQGWCVEGFVVCPYHRQQFDLKTGRGLEGQGNYITIYSLQRDGDKWFVQVKGSLFKRLFS